MKPLLAVVLFGLGVHLALRTVAALYRIIDLWYAIKTAYPQVLRGVIGWGGATVAVAVLLPQAYRSAFLLGQVSFLGFHLSLHLILPAFLRRRETPSKRSTAAVDPGA